MIDQIINFRNIIQTDGGLTYRVVYCSFDPQGRNIPPGTTAEAKIYIGKIPFLFFLLGIK